MNTGFSGSGSSTEGLSVLNVDLSFLATQAALELSAVIGGEESAFEKVNELSRVMRSSFSVHYPASQGSLYDPSVVTMMNGAFEESSYGRMNTVEELVEKARKLSDTMAEQTDPSKRNGELTNLMNFCIALARCAAVYRKSVFGYRPKHPYRK